MSFLVYGTQTFSFNEEETDVNDFISSTIGLKPEDYWISGNNFLYIVHLRLCGGKGGFGRAMKQEGERRSRRLPFHHDNCRTLSGRRIGSIRAKKKVDKLRNQIKELEKKRAEMKAIQKRENAEKELEKLENTEQEAESDVHDAVKFAFQHQQKKQAEDTDQDSLLPINLLIPDFLFQK